MQDDPIYVPTASGGGGLMIEPTMDDIRRGEAMERASLREHSEAQAKRIEELERDAGQLAQQCGCLEPDEDYEPACDPPCIVCHYIKFATPPAAQAAVAKVDSDD